MKTLQGTVVSLKTPRTAQVRVARQWQHPLYKKSVKRTKRYACDYQGLELALGDTVIIRESRPLSKTKRFVVVEKVVEGAQ
ncbi:MAG: 30S ribosomal protein S17 [Pseudomonadales bacterium]|nr:30S ribosomal protein S17 [Candidatus Woesebacteria bacterium]MCB9801714.1 30S ribosomal protein S17 [Pseudomonadales bacterium]